MTIVRIGVREPQNENSRLRYLTVVGRYNYVKKGCIRKIVNKGRILWIVD
jgi:hypothetical protein